MADPQDSVSVTSLLLLAAIGAFAVRYFFFTPGSSGSSGTGSLSNRQVIDMAQVEHIAGMFPQLSRRDIAWDLQRRGGSVAATTESVLLHGGLEAAPISFQPNLPQPTRVSATTNTKSEGNHIDLIKRYNLSARVGKEDKGKGERREAQSSWSANKAERQTLLQQRREDMILAARRKMQAKERERAELQVDATG